MQYSEFNNMPTYVRKYIIDRVIEDNTPKSGK